MAVEAYSLNTCMHVAAEVWEATTPTPLSGPFRHFAPVEVDASLAVYFQASSPEGATVPFQPPFSDRHFTFTLHQLLCPRSRHDAVHSIISGIFNHQSVRFFGNFLSDFLTRPVGEAFQLGVGMGVKIFVSFGAATHRSGLESEGGGVGALGGVPAAPEAIRGLEVVKYGGGEVESCSICLDEFGGEEMLTRMPCSHVFHGWCLTRWLERSRLCPLCRHAMPPAAAAS